MDFELTRFENDERLLSQIEAIKSAENIQVLSSFAKAYLGMFYVIDSELAAIDKVKLLANDELADAIFTGFLSSLSSEEIPSIEKIGDAAAIKKEYAEGYVILAGLDLMAKKSLADVQNLNPAIIEKAVAFHFSNKSGYPDIWFDYLLAKNSKIIIPAISRYWRAMLENNTTYLPGINFVLGDKPDVQIIQYCVLQLLQHWTSCKAKILFQLLHLAFKYSEKNDFLSVCVHVLDHDEKLNEKTRLYWMAAAYFLSPDKYFAMLRAGLCESVFLGFCTISDVNVRLVGDQIQWAVPTVAEGMMEYDFDPDRARQLLADAGWDSDTTLNLWLMAQAAPEAVIQAINIMQAQWADVGIDVVITNVDVPTLLDNLGREQVNNDLHMFWNAGAVFTLDPSSVQPYNLCSTAYPNGPNLTQYCDESTDALWAEARLSGDQDVRAPLYKEIFLAENKNPNNLHIAVIDNIVAYDSRLKGVLVQGDHWATYWNISDWYWEE